MIKCIINHLLHILVISVIIYLNQNTPDVKKVAAKNLKKGCAEKDVKSKWAAKASCC